MIVGVSVPTSDFIEYLQELSDLYNGEVPVSVLYDTPMHIKELIDLLSNVQEFLEEESDLSQKDVV